MALSILLLITLLCIAAECYDSQYRNRFDATRGCSQYTTSEGYNHAHPYFATAEFRNPPVESKNGEVKFRMGVLGPFDPSIRLAPKARPYDSTLMHEIALAHWQNQHTEGRSYTRSGPAGTAARVAYNRKATPGLMDPTDPFMFTITIYNGGRVTLTRDDESAPFYEFNANGVKPSHKYIGFANWTTKLVFFFDCPLEPTEACSVDRSSQIVPF